MTDAQSPSPITVEPLPLLPHPASLSSSSSFLIQEARRSFHQLSALRQNIYAESSKYVLDPPGPSSLPPLPPIPLPPTTTYRKPSAQTALSSSSRPLIKPALDASSPFLDKTTLKACVETLEGLGHTADRRYNDTALWVGIDCINAWVLLRDDGAPALTSVRAVRIFASSEGERPLHMQPASAPYRALGSHLTELNLSLPELLDRMIALPDLLDRPCHYCQKHFKVPEGMPYARTGYLAHSFSGAEGQNEAPDPRGRWVSWHDSCEQLS